MADYFTHFSCLLDVGTPQKAVQAIDFFVARCDEDDQSEEPQLRGFDLSIQDGCFEATVRYFKGSMRKIRDYAPKDQALHSIADRLQAGPAPVSFRSFESNTRHQGDRIWQRYTATSSSGMRFASRKPVA